MVALSLITSLVFAIVLTLSWNGQFNNYTRDTLEEYANTAAESLAREYDKSGYWSTTNVYNAINTIATVEDMGIQLVNADGVIIYDNTWIMTNIDENTGAKISLAPQDSATVKSTVYSKNGNRIGTVKVWVFGSDAFLTTRDKDFRWSSFLAMGISAIVAIILAVLLGLVVSRKLTKPVRTISAAAQRIKEGDLTVRSGVSGTDDIGRLGETFDEMAESIQQDRELERRITADVAHELRTPLMSITATVEGMRDGVIACDDEHLALLNNEAMRLSRLVDSMLRLSRLENGSVQLKIKPHDIIAFARDIATTHSALLEGTGLEMHFENNCDQDSLICEFDRDTINQALTNIISNSMRYTPAPGTVTIRVSEDASHAKISVSDTGIGIAKEDLSRVFSRFWRAEESRSRVAGGLGVGLAVTKEIVDRHHGNILVDSEPGVGTTFTIVLPLTQPK